jgi:DNA-binding response OmpR family regulator
MRVLVVEDQAELADDIADGLRDQGIGADVAYDGSAAIEKALLNPYDVVVLDRDLPRIHGDAVCATLVGSPSEARILMLTAAGTVDDRVDGLNLGADDYLTKPFSMAELLARVKALLRRAELMRKAQSLAQGAGSTLRNGEIEVLVSRREVRVRGQAVELTALEFDLLLYFAQHPGHVFSRAQLLDAVWGYSHEGYEHTVTTHINRLRAKLEADPMRPLVILTVRGAGYKMRDAPA